MASSLVGVKIRARIGLGQLLAMLVGLAKSCNIGIAKAAVFPVPVCAHPSKSFCANTCGMAASWMGVGLT